MIANGNDHARLNYYYAMFRILMQIENVMVILSSASATECKENVRRINIMSPFFTIDFDSFPGNLISTTK